MPLNGREKGGYRFDRFTVDLFARTLSDEDGQIPLTPKVFDLLTVFVERPGDVLEKEKLLELLWPDSFVEEANLAQNIAVLRKALKENSRQPKLILTVPGRGYRFIADVERISENKHEVSNVQTKAQATEYKTSRSFLRIFLPVAAAIILFAFVFWLYLQISKPAETLKVDRASQLTTWSGLDLSPVVSSDGKTFAFSSDRNGTFEIYLRQIVSTARDVQVTNDGNQNFQPAFSPDGDLIAYHSKNRGGIWLIPVTGGVAKQLSPFGSQPAFSPDGSMIAFQSDPLNDLSGSVRNAMPPSTIWIVPVGGGEPVQVTMPGNPAGGHGAPAWSPDGKSIAFDVNDWASSVLAMVQIDNREVRLVKTQDFQGSEPIFSPDGRYLYFVANTGISIQRIAIESVDGKAEKVFDSSGTRIRQISMDASGRRLIYSSIITASNIWASSLQTTEQAPVPLTRNSYTRTVIPTFSPSGGKIAYQSFTTGGMSYLWTMNSDGTDQKQMSSRSGFYPNWTSDGTGIFFISSDRDIGGATSLWHVTSDAGVEKKVLDFDEEVYNARTSKDGKTVFFASKRSGTVNIWAMPTEGGSTRQLTFDNELAGFPAVSPDGKLIGLQLKRGEDTHVAILPVDGGAVTQLTFDKGQSWLNDFSPDSKQIIFAGQRDGIWNIYSISIETKEVKRITNFSKLNSYVRYPAWSPLNDRIAYEYAETTGNIWMLDLQ